MASKHDYDEPNTEQNVPEMQPEIREKLARQEQRVFEGQNPYTGQPMPMPMSGPFGGMLSGAAVMPLRMELPIAQVSTGKARKEGSTGKLRSWVTGDLARYVEKAQAQGASRVVIQVNAVYE